jgi:hypothetical protein
VTRLPIGTRRTGPIGFVGKFAIWAWNPAQRKIGPMGRLRLAGPPPSTAREAVMKPMRGPLFTCVLAAVAGAALASTGSLVNFKPRVLPVVVAVNRQGHVTDILPAVALSRQYQQLLVKQLDAWIVKPATVKGRPVGSRFIVEVAMRAAPRHDGRYDASFVYVRSLPLAYGGALHWNVINGGLEYALVSDASTPGGRSRFEMMTFQMNRKPFVPQEIEPVRRSADFAQPASHASQPTPPMPTMRSRLPDENARATGAPRVERP